MLLSSLKRETLLENTKKIVAQERSFTASVVKHLIEIHKRKLALEMGYGSTFSFCTDYLGYSESGASRRTQAMYLSIYVPQANVAERIE